ncbi:MAG: hypothetical protein WCF16_02495 [Alphaproteobacteria bacterium]
MFEAATALEALAVREPEPVEAAPPTLREAFSAGFRAVIDTPFPERHKRVERDEPYEWAFDGPVAKDLEPQAWDAWLKRPATPPRKG